MTQYTPGPWRAEKTRPTTRTTGAWHVFDAFGTTAVVLGNDDEAAANARLIAAAPELLEALRGLLNTSIDYYTAIKRARTAIGKTQLMYDDGLPQEAKE